MDLTELKQLINFEYSQRNCPVFHVMVSQYVLEQTSMSQDAFGLYLLDKFAALVGTRVDLPLVSTFEMNNKKGAHYHYAVYLDDVASAKYRTWAATKKAPTAYLVVAFKKMIAPLMNIDEARSSKDIKGISFLEPEVKTASMVDYFIKENSSNLKHLNCDLTVGDIDLSDTIVRKFYRKNSQGSKPEGGVRALFPSKRSGLLNKRNTIDGDFVDEIVKAFVSKRVTPTETEFRLFLHDEYQISSYSENTYKLVFALCERAIGLSSLVNPRYSLLQHIKDLRHEYNLFMEQYENNRDGAPEMFSFQYKYMANAVKLLLSPQFLSIYEWIAEFVVVDQDERDRQKNRALIIQGPSNSGKTAFTSVIFPQKIFGTVGLKLNSPYATRGMYSHKCMLWLFRDINRNMNAESLLELQNLIDGDEVRRAIRGEEVQGLVPPRPIIACTTSDIEDKFDRVTAAREDDLQTRCEQFKNRITIVKFPETREKKIGSRVYLRGEIIDFLSHTDLLHVPEWLPFYLFWEEYFSREEGILERITPTDDQIQGIFSLLASPVIELPTNTQETEDVETREIDLSVNHINE